MTWVLESFISEGLPTTIYRSMSTKIHQRVVHKAIYQSMSINLYRRVVHKNKYICFENSFLYMENACVRESVRTRGMGYDM